jgi:hypothetical protein
VGFALLYSLLAYFGPRGRTAAGVLTAAFLLGAFAFNHMLDLRWILKTRGATAAVQLPSVAAAENLPVVVEGPLMFIETLYRNPHLRPSLYYLVDPETTTGRYPQASQDQPLLNFKQFQPDLHVERLAEFLPRHKRFVIWGMSDSPLGGGWILERILEMGGRVQIVSMGETRRVLLVSFE